MWRMDAFLPGSTFRTHARTGTVTYGAIVDTATHVRVWLGGDGKRIGIGQAPASYCPPGTPKTTSFLQKLNFIETPHICNEVTRQASNHNNNKYCNRNNKPIRLFQQL